MHISVLAKLLYFDPTGLLNSKLKPLLQGQLLIYIFSFLHKAYLQLLLTMCVVGSIVF